VWAQRAKLGAEKVNLAAQAKLWAERKARELLAQTPSLGRGGDRRSGHQVATRDLMNSASTSMTRRASGR
jgi:hypothetical protein